MIWIGVDAHKQVHQALALGSEGILAERTFPNSAAGWAALLEWAHAWADRLWAVEGSGALGRGVAQFLVRAGERVHEVSGQWTAQRRRTMRKPGKSDRLDAHAVARLLREEAETLPRVIPEQVAPATAQVWSRVRVDLVRDRTRVRNRLHALLLQCDPEYHRHLPALTSRAGIRACLAYEAPAADAITRERAAAVRLVAAQLALLAEQERELRGKLVCLVEQSFPALTSIEGVGPLIAAGIVAELGPPRPGLGEAQLAALAGVAPLEASSAGGTRHRLNRQGNRRLNQLFHQIVLTQSRLYQPAQAYLARRQAEGRTAREARRALKRHLVRRIWRAWQACWFDAPQALPRAA